MKRFVCIHGHFYQPPRENPWLEVIEFQDSAYPYPDWNERITAECYAPNVNSRILSDKNYIIDIVNNYAKISFNFGPTLLSWMERFQPEIYAHVLQADKQSQEYFSSHGAAIAQAYNHMIMPLANDRDKRTQVIWGIQDFKNRFKREPEGMWLPETAVDTSTLEILAEYGIKFTILAPHQAKMIRKIGEKSWHPIDESWLDTQIPYSCFLPSGRKIILFFYNGPISQDIAFRGLLNNGEGFANRLIQAFPHEHRELRLVHVATDGETYGHHHLFGNMALSYCLHHIEKYKLAKITIPAEFIELYPAQYEVQIHENSSWSCAHGVERWRSNCGCCTGNQSHWNQQWRAPLRAALDWLRDQVSVIFEKEMGLLCGDPWDVRNKYVELMLHRDSQNINHFINQYSVKELLQQDRIKFIKLLEMQRHGLFMYTSCGWFFDEISGLESVQIIQYAARVIQLLREITEINLEPEFVSKLESAKSNIPELKDGAHIYSQQIKPAIINMLDVGAHYAIFSVFEDFPSKVQVYSYTIDILRHEKFEAGKQKLVIGKANIRSDITLEESVIDFGVLHFGDYHLSGGVRTHSGEDFELMLQQLKEIFSKNNIPELIQSMNNHFGRHNFTLWDLFKNEQGKVLNQIFNHTLRAIEVQFREIYEHYYPLMQIKPDFRIPLPKALSMTVEFILNRDLLDGLEKENPDFAKLENLVKEIKRWSFNRDRHTLNYVVSGKIHGYMERFSKNPLDLNLLKPLCELLRIFDPLSLELDLSRTQNLYFAMTKTIYPKMYRQKDPNDTELKAWFEYFEKLGEYLKVDYTRFLVKEDAPVNSSTPIV